MGTIIAPNMPTDDSSSQWWHKPFGVVQTNIREIDASMNVNEVADWIQSFGATAWLLGVGGIQAQYPTNLPFQASNPYLSGRKSGDLVGDALQAAHSRGLKFLARMDFSKIPSQVAAEHPEWCYISANGEFQEHTGSLVSVCPCGDYYQKRILDILEEVAGRYPIDGLFFNWATMNEKDYYQRYHGPCHCGNCQARWRKFSRGLELPQGPKDKTYDQWLIFGQQVIDGIGANIRAVLKERLPNAALIRGATANIIYQESNNEIGRQPWHHGTSEKVSSWISFRPDHPVLSNSTCFLDKPYRMTGEDPFHFAQYLIQSISRGGTPSTYMMGVPGKIPYPCLTIASEITRFHKTWSSEVYERLRPSSKTGLVRPEVGHMNSQEYKEALSEFRGIYSAMQESHVPFDVLAMERLVDIQTHSGLERYKVIILPNLGQLLPGIAEVLDIWVDRGGSLIATGSSGIDDSGTVQLQSLPCLRQRAAVTKLELLWSSYISTPRVVRDIHHYEGPLIPLHGAYHYYEWRADRQIRTEYQQLARAPFAPPEKAYGNLEVEHPGLVVGHYGAGQGIVIPFTVGWAYHEIELSCIKNFFIDAWKTADAQEIISFDLPPQVEITINQSVSGKRTVIHLVNMSGAKRVGFGPHLPISEGIIKISASASNLGKISARALHADKELIIADGMIKLPTLELFEVVVIEGINGQTPTINGSHNVQNTTNSKIADPAFKGPVTVNSLACLNGVTELHGGDAMNGLSSVRTLNGY